MALNSDTITIITFDFLGKSDALWVREWPAEAISPGLHIQYLTQKVKYWLVLVECRCRHYVSDRGPLRIILLTLHQQIMHTVHAATYHQCSASSSTWTGGWIGESQTTLLFHCLESMAHARVGKRRNDPLECTYSTKTRSRCTKTKYLQVICTNDMTYGQYMYITRKNLQENYESIFSVNCFHSSFKVLWLFLPSREYFLQGIVFVEAIWIILLKMLACLNLWNTAYLSKQ